MDQGKIVEQRDAFFAWLGKMWDNSEPIERIELELMGQFGQNQHVTHWYVREGDFAKDLAVAVYAAATEDAKCFSGVQKYCVLAHPKVVVPADDTQMGPAWVRAMGQSPKPSRKLFAVLGGEEVSANGTEALYAQLPGLFRSALGDVDDVKMRAERMACGTRVLAEMVNKEGYSREKLPLQVGLAAEYTLALEDKVAPRPVAAADQPDDSSVH